MIRGRRPVKSTQQLKEEQIIFYQKILKKIQKNIKRQLLQETIK